MGKPERLAQVRVIGNKNRYIAVATAGVEHQVRGERDVGALFLSLYYLDCLRSAGRWVGKISTRHTDVKDAEMY